jgi:hypothetical protein
MVKESEDKNPECPVDHRLSPEYDESVQHLGFFKTKIPPLDVTFFNCVEVVAENISLHQLVVLFQAIHF